jgi:pSer/pThr/pTyr-binding forkhead associated (FHA) protein
MAHVVIKVKGNEIASLNLTGPTLVGRAGDCRISVQDTLLSRHHLRLQPDPKSNGKSWAVVDLASANGTLVDGERILRHQLSDGDLIHAGHLSIVFFEDSLAGGGSGDARNPLVIGEKALSAESTIAAATAVPHVPQASPPSASKVPTSRVSTPPIATAPLSEAKPQFKFVAKGAARRGEEWDQLAKTHATRPGGSLSLVQRINKLPLAVGLTAAAITWVLLFAIVFYFANLIMG